MREAVLDAVKRNIRDDVAGHHLRHVALCTSNAQLARLRAREYNGETHIVVLERADQVGRHRAEDLREDLAVRAGGVLPEVYRVVADRVRDGAVLVLLRLVRVRVRRRALERVGLVVAVLRRDEA